MIANPSEFEVVLQRYEDDPGVCSKLLRNHALSDPANFLAYSQTAILNLPVSRVLKFISGLAISAGILQVLLDIHPRDRHLAIALAKRLQQCEPRFDVTMMEYLLRPSPGVPLEEGDFLVILDLLDQISDTDLLVPSMLKLLKHPNPKVRSKAALFVGSRTQNMAWATSRTQEYDPRVRANIIESLFGLNSEFVQQMFRSHVNDENNRVAGNAVFGLYQLGDATSIPMIYDMAHHADARMRNTAAWLMGRTGDPRFTSVFLELLNDPDELVRAQAFKGLGELRKATRALATLPTLDAALVELSRGENESAIVTVKNSDGQPVRGIQPTQFIVKSGAPSKPLLEFKVEEYDSKASLHLGFILCLPKHAFDALELSFVTTLSGLAAQRRPKDRWAIAKISGERSHSRVDALAGAMVRARQKWAILNVNAITPATVAPFEAKFEYSVLESRIDQMMREQPLRLTEDPAEDAEMVVKNLLRVDIAAGRPHWIIVGAGEQSPLLANLMQRPQPLEAAVHVLAVSKEWNLAGRALADQTNGSFQSMSDTAQVEETLKALHSSLLHHYRVTWPTATASIEIDVNSDRGRASLTEMSGSHEISDQPAALRQGEWLAS